MTDTNNLNPDGSTPNPDIKEPEKTVEQTPPQADPVVDYKEKFGASTAENQRIMAENKAKDEEIERLRKIAESGASYGNDPDIKYPGFEELDDEAKRNLIEFTKGVEKSTLDRVYQDPAIAFSKQLYNQNRWNEAFEKVSNQFPQLRDEKEKAEFKAKYFRADNVPQNIDDILPDVAKVYLFDKAQDIGAIRAAEQANRLDAERSNGGDKTPPATRTAEDWAQMAKNPSEFAKHAAQFNEDLNSGKL